MKKLPNKTQTRRKTSYAIQIGKLKRKSCKECGDIKSQAHHTDYSKPLKIMGLCAKHHREWHKKNGDMKGENEYTFRAIFVKRETHKKFALRAVKEELTFDELINELLKVKLSTINK